MLCQWHASLAIAHAQFSLVGDFWGMGRISLFDNRSISSSCTVNASSYWSIEGSQKKLLRDKAVMSGLWHTSGTPIQVTDREPTSINVLPTPFAHAASAGATSSLETRPYNDREESPSRTSCVSGEDDEVGNTAEYSPQSSNLQKEDDLNVDTYAVNNPFFEYRNLVGSISEKLRKENALRLAYVYALPEWYYEVGPTHDPTSALRILMALEGKGIFAPNNLAGLTKALETIEREDLAQLVREFRKLIIHHSANFTIILLSYPSNTFFFLRKQNCYGNGCSWQKQHSSSAGEPQ